MLQKVVYAGAQSRSFRQAHGALAALAELDVSEKQVERLTEQIGDERVAQRNQAVEAFLKLPLMAKVSSPLAVSPDLAVVEMDGGRLQILDRAGPTSEPAPEQEPTGDDPAYRDEPECDGESARKDAGYWREDKIGVLIKMSSKESSEDPCPEIPEHFINPLFVGKLTREIHGSAAAVEQSSAAEVEAMKEEHAKGKHDWIPKPLVRPWSRPRRKPSVLQEFVAQAAWARGFAGARRKAFVADGASTNWAIHRRWFSDYTGILDFIHCLSYVFAAAIGGVSIHNRMEHVRGVDHRPVGRPSRHGHFRTGGVARRRSVSRPRTSPTPAHATWWTTTPFVTFETTDNTCGMMRTAEKACP